MTPRWQAIELSIGAEDLAGLVCIAWSRAEPASRVERAQSFAGVAEVLCVYREVKII
jgi:hypothetical protein